MLLHFAFWTPIANFLCFEFWILITDFLLFAFWVPIVNFLILLYFAFWNFGFQFTSIQTLALNGYEPGMNIHCLIGNLKAGTSCLGVKCCPLIGHLGTVKGNGLMQCGQGWVRRAFAVQTRDSPRAGENEYHPVCCNGTVQNARPPAHEFSTCACVRSTASEMRAPHPAHNMHNNCRPCQGDQSVGSI